MGKIFLYQQQMFNPYYSIFKNRLLDRCYNACKISIRNDFLRMYVEIVLQVVTTNIEVTTINISVTFKNWRSIYEKENKKS